MAAGGGGTIYSCLSHTLLIFPCVRDLIKVEMRDSDIDSKVVSPVGAAQATGKISIVFVNPLVGSRLLVCYSQDRIVCHLDGKRARTGPVIHQAAYFSLGQRLSFINEYNRVPGE